MAEATFSKYYTAWRKRKETLLKESAPRLAEEASPLPASIIEACARAWTAEFQELRKEFSIQGEAARVAARQEVRDLEDKMQETVETIHILAEKYDAALHEADTLKSANVQGKETINKLETENALASDRIAALEKLLNDSQDAHAATNKELMETIAKLGAAEAKLTNALAQNTQLETLLTTEKEQAEILGVTVATLTTQVLLSNGSDGTVEANQALIQEKVADAVLKGRGKRSAERAIDLTNPSATAL